MDWIFHYHLFLFDFDGLLVNTEKIHYNAYKKMCQRRGYQLTWTFAKYCSIAHTSATGLRENIYDDFPQLQQQEPIWEILYGEKKQCYMELLTEQPVELMAGAAELLALLEEAQVKRCVVTHSPLEQIQRIRKHQPLLDSITEWFTREDYTHPKPHPDGYLKAIEKLASKSDRIIGFEDSLRGIESLLQTPAQPVAICPPNTSYLKEILQHKNVLHYSSLTDFMDSALPPEKAL
jgi:HAD superfamily hydrolase (TIGR01509 family)